MRIELLNGSTKKEIEERVRRVATAANISHNSRHLFDLYESRTNYEKNLEIIEKILASGHDSIAEHDFLSFGITEVTPIIEHVIIGQRLASFTIKSRRYVDFGNSGFYTPDFNYLKNSHEVKKKYDNHMNYLFNTYSEMVDCGVPKEDARLVLPYCFHSQITMTLNARMLIKLIEYCLKSNMSQIPEVKKFGLELLEISKKTVPYYKKRYDEFDRYIEEGKQYVDKLAFLDKKSHEQYKILETPKLISVKTDYDMSSMSKVDRTIIVSNLMNRYQIDIEKADKVYNQLSEKEKKQIMEIICLSKENRELEQVSFRYMITTTLSGETHWVRQRMQEIITPDFLPMYNLNNYIIPKTIKEKCLDIYLEAVNRNIQIYEQLKQMGVEEKELVYFNLSGTMINVQTNINGRELLWISRLRCCNRAQWEIREAANEMVEQVKKEAPLYGEYLGAPCGVVGKCPEGKHSCGNPYVYKRR